MAIEKSDLKGVSHISDTTLMNELESNLKMFFDWGFLRIRGWFDVERPSTGTIYSGNFAKLRLVDDPSFSAGQAWEGPKQDWVWETDVDYIGTDLVTYNPIIIPSDVTVNSISTPYDWIDYPLGRVYFNTPISTSATVLAEYSYRWVQVFKATSCDWWKELQYRSFRSDDSHFTLLETGMWSIGGQFRIQMPAIVIEAVPRAISRPYQLGDGSAWVSQDVICYVFAENSIDRNKLVDILRGQFDNNIWLFNSNEISAAQDWPLDNRGMLLDSTRTYKNLADENTGYPWIRCRFASTQVMEIERISSRLHTGAVKLTCEVILPD